MFAGDENAAAMLTLFDVQVIALSVLLIGTLTCGILPIFFFRTSKCLTSGTTGGNRIMSFLIYFGGGVLMTTCFLHLLPEAREYFENDERQDYEQNNGNSSSNKTSPSHVGHKNSFSIPEFIVLCGFFATYLIEEAIHHILLLTRGSSQSLNQEFRLKFCSCAQRHTECSRTFKDVKPNQSLLGMEKKKLADLLSTSQSFPVASACNDESNMAARDLLQSSIIVQPVPNYGTLTTVVTPDVDPVVESPTSSPQPLIATDPALPQHNLHMHQHQLHQHLHHHSQEQISISSLLTVAALSFHSVFEGFAIGFQNTVMDTWTLLLAVSLHKFVVSFVVGIEVVADGARWILVVAYISVFSIMSPLGTALAMFASRSVDNMPEIVIGVVNSIACGTLLYVTFYEILRKELDGGVTGFMRYFSILLGAGIMSALQYASTVF